MNTNPDEPAYPTDSELLGRNPGLTKREHFAALAMQGMFANSNLYSAIAKAANSDTEKVARMIAIAAKEAADGLIHILNQPRP